MSRLQRVLDRLENPRRYGKGWRTRCPAHDGRNTSALSLAEGDDGRVLIKCFAGCETRDVLASIGLQFRDVMPTRVTHATSRQERAELRRASRWAKCEAARSMLQLEARVVAVAGDQIRAGKPLDDSDQARLALACERIAQAEGVFRA